LKSIRARFRAGTVQWSLPGGGNGRFRDGLSRVLAVGRNRFTDSHGKLGPQSDGWAYFSTRPPYAWVPGEAVFDGRVLSLPKDLPRGTYSLEVGLYEPDGEGRLPAYLNGSRQDQDRVLLAHIELLE
jgi:hypothetical protein